MSTDDTKNRDNVRDSIVVAATAFRSALDRVDRDTWAKVTVVTSFPHGACGHCAGLLARYLSDRLDIEPSYASGRVSYLVDGKTHAWIEYDGLFIDISADQFGLPPVIVEAWSPFHDQATEVTRHPIINDHWWGQYAAPVYTEALGILGI